MFIKTIKPLPPAWQAYRDLFAEVQRANGWSRETLAEKLTEDAKVKGLPKCNYCKRSTEYWETNPTAGKRHSAPRDYRVAHLHQWFSEQITDAKFTERLEAIAPSTAERVPLPFPFFGEIQIRPWQEIASSERPYRFPPPDRCSMPPFPPKKGMHYASGCNIRLRPLTRYDLKPLIRPQPTWPEIEIVLYQAVGRDITVDASWMRMASYGAVSSGKGPTQITPEGGHWLLTCWGKRRIAWDEPWWPLEPIDCTLDKTGKKLTASFAPPMHPPGLPAIQGRRDSSTTTVAVLEILADSQAGH